MNRTVTLPEQELKVSNDTVVDFTTKLDSMGISFFCDNPTEFEMGLSKLKISSKNITLIEAWISNNVTEDMPKDAIEKIFLKRATEASKADLNSRITTQAFKYLSFLVFADIVSYQKNIPVRLTESEKRLADGVLEELREISEKGLNPVYESFGNYLFDMYPNLSWNRESSYKEIKYILAHPDFPGIAAKIQETLNFDIKKDLESALIADEEIFDQIKGD